MTLGRVTYRHCDLCAAGRECGGLGSELFTWVLLCFTVVVRLSSGRCVVLCWELWRGSIQLAQLPLRRAGEDKA